MLNSMKLLKPFWKPVHNALRSYSYPTYFMNFLRNQPKTEVTCLDNGLRIVSETREACNVCFGLYVDAGSRYESLFDNGITHFFEHIVFKSTVTRNMQALESQLNDTGARFRCFTTREMVAYYCECIVSEAPRCFELLVECVLNNAYDDNIIEAQKETVYAEMMEHDANPVKVMYDNLHVAAFQGTPLAQPVMGPSTNLHNFCSATISRHVDTFFDPTRTVLAAVGGLTHEQLVGLAQRYLLCFEPTKCAHDGNNRFTAGEVTYRNDGLPLANIAIAVEGPSFCDEDKYTMEVAKCIMGGWDKSQPPVDLLANPVAQAAAAGLCDAYKSFSIYYKDVSLWGVHLLIKSIDIDDMLVNVQQGWMRLSTMLTQKEVVRAKRDLKIKMLMEAQSAEYACHDLGRWILYNNCKPPLHHRFDEIDAIHSGAVMKTCDKYLYDRCVAIAGVGPTEGLPEYNRIRAQMYWLRA